MKRFSIFILMILAYHVNGQNVGINNTDPQTTLDVNGKFRIRSTGFAVSSGINVLTNSGTSYYSLNGNPGADFEVILPTGVKGTFLIVENATDGGFTASVSGFGTIPPGKSKLLLFGDTGWVLAHESEESQLEKTTEGGNTGWRLLTENPDYHGNIGQKAMDLSVSTLGANSIYGATGDYAVALGSDVISEGVSAIAIGKDLKANGLAATSLGSGNEVNGDYSTALGNDNVINTSHGAVAIGSINELNNANNSMALGSANIVNANAASAIGESNTVSGIAATAIGSNNNTEGDYAASIGFANAAIGNNSLAIGNSNGAWNENAIAMGNESEALGVTTTAMGTSWTSSLLSVSMGRYSDTIVGSNRNTWVNTDPLFIIGNGSSDTDRKNAMIVYKNGTLQLENHTTTPANSSDKFYVQNNEPFFGTQKLQASQLEKITEGGNTGWRLAGRDNNNYGNIGIDAVDFSISVGPSSIAGATGERSFALGSTTTASGNKSTAMGWLTKATGDASTAMGFGANASPYASVALGRYNDTIVGSSRKFWVNTDPLLIVGNGIDNNNRSNALTVYKNANTEISGYTRLGLASEGAPFIKTKKFTGNTSSTYNGDLQISHSPIPASKILSVSVFVEWTTNQFVPPAFASSPDLVYNYYLDSANIVIRNNTPVGNCTICDKPVKVLITYEE